MSATPLSQFDKITIPYILSRKNKNKTDNIVCLTAYDCPIAQILDEAGVDVVLVGDSVATTRLGYNSTIPLTVDETLIHLRAVRRGIRRALLVTDLPYGSYHLNNKTAVKTALVFIKEGAEAIKIEGGQKRKSLVKRLVKAEIPVMGHVGLTPQSYNVMGGYRVQGKNLESAEAVRTDALTLQDAGVFSVVLEGIPENLASAITEELEIPTIGIGAGRYCDGQILVSDDIFGLTPKHKPKFVRQYLDLRQLLSQATRQFILDCNNGNFPNQNETYFPTEFGRLEEVIKH
tara:strand:+ start:1292 stop:2158 length:867 start_codon:yes stop_codon:yes gene_type:complete